MSRKKRHSFFFITKKNPTACPPRECISAEHPSGELAKKFRRCKEAEPELMILMEKNKRIPLRAGDFLEIISPLACDYSKVASHLGVALAHPWCSLEEVVHVYARCLSLVKEQIYVDILIGLVMKFPHRSSLIYGNLWFFLKNGGYI